MAKWVWFVLGGAALGLAVFLFMNKKSDREAILEKARQAKAEKKENEPAATNGEG